MTAGLVTEAGMTRYCLKQGGQRVDQARPPAAGRQAGGGGGMEGGRRQLAQPPRVCTCLLST